MSTVYKKHSIYSSCIHFPLTLWNTYSLKVASAFSLFPAAILLISNTWMWHGVYLHYFVFKKKSIESEHHQNVIVITSFHTATTSSASAILHRQSNRLGDYHSKSSSASSNHIVRECTYNFNKDKNCKKVPHYINWHCCSTDEIILSNNLHAQYSHVSKAEAMNTKQ